MIEKKSKVRIAIDNLINDAIIFLKEPFEDKPPAIQKLYTEEEKKELYGIKKDLEQYPERDQEW